jgi:poly(3-hydroxyalkanoate) synthetase
MNEAFIDGNVWVIEYFPVEGVSYNYHMLNNIFYYNSLQDRTFEKYENKIFIPEKFISGLYSNLYSENELLKGYNSVKDFVIDNKDIIIKNKCFIMKKDIINFRERWSVDLNMLFYDKNKNWRNNA